MNIGEFKMVNGQLIGWIATREIDLPRLGLRPVNSTNERAPKYEFVALNPGKRWVQIGALWEAVSNSSGELFLQGSVDDPSFAAPMPVALFGDDETGYRVAWTRPKAAPRPGIDGATKPKRGAPTAFGEGNADDNGQVTRERELDEEVPF